MPEGSSTSSKSQGSSDSIDSTKEITSTERTEPLQTEQHKKSKKLLPSKSHSQPPKKFYAKSCSSKILGVRGRKDISGPPFVPTHFYSHRNQYRHKLEKSHEIARENARIVQRLSQIYTKGGVVDNHLAEYPRVYGPAMFRHHKFARIAAENFYLYRRLQNVAPILSRHDQLVWYAEQEEHMERLSKYPLFFQHQPCYKDPVYKSLIPQKAYALLEIGYGKKQVKSDILVMELLTHDSPASSVNFLVACEDTRSKEFCLQGKSIDKLVSIAVCQSKYKRAYWKVGASTEIQQKDEHCIKMEENKLKHTEAGLLTRPLGIATGEFYITIGPSPFLDGKCCIFGRLIGDSLAFLKKMEKENIDIYGNPLTPMVIQSCSTASSILDIYLNVSRKSTDSEVSEKIEITTSEELDKDDDSQEEEVVEEEEKDGEERKESNEEKAGDKDKEDDEGEENDESDDDDSKEDEDE